MPIRAPANLVAVIDDEAAKLFTNRSQYVRQCVLQRMQADGLDVTALAERPPKVTDAHLQPEEYALVHEGKVTALKLGAKPEPGTYGNRPGEWLPVLTIDEAEFDPAKHYRQLPYFTVDGERALRVCPIINKSEDC
jgi:hypothetical protein